MPVLVRLTVLFLILLWIPLSQAQTCREIFSRSNYSFNRTPSAGGALVKTVMQETQLVDDSLIVKLAENISTSSSAKVGPLTYKQFIQSLPAELSGNEKAVLADLTRHLQGRGEEAQNLAVELADLLLEARAQKAKILVVSSQDIGLRSQNYLLSQNIYLVQVENAREQIPRITAALQKRLGQDTAHLRFNYGPGFYYPRVVKDLNPSDQLLFDFGYFLAHTSDPLNLTKLGQDHPEGVDRSADTHPASATALFRSYVDIFPLSFRVRHDQGHLQVQIDERPFSIAEQIFNDIVSHPERVLLGENLAPYLPVEVKAKLEQARNETEENEILALYMEQALSFYLNAHFAAYQKNFFERPRP